MDTLNASWTHQPHSECADELAGLVGTYASNDLFASCQSVHCQRSRRLAYLMQMLRWILPRLNNTIDYLSGSIARRCKSESHLRIKAFSHKSRARETKLRFVRLNFQEKTSAAITILSARAIDARIANPSPREKNILKE